tara:strand:- start:4411 stop:4638 length:228 start_codon:yes stop_codon:yes gene_type:complete
MHYVKKYIEALDTSEITTQEKYDLLKKDYYEYIDYTVKAMAQQEKLLNMVQGFLTSQDNILSKLKEEEGADNGSL